MTLTLAGTFLLSIQKINHPAVCLVYLASVEIDVDIRNCIPAMPQGRRDRLGYVEDMEKRMVVDFYSSKTMSIRLVAECRTFRQWYDIRSRRSR